MSKAENSVEVSVIFPAKNPQAKFWSNEMALFARIGKSIKSQLESHKTSLLLVKPDCNKAVITV